MLTARSRVAALSALALGATLSIAALASSGAQAAPTPLATGSPLRLDAPDRVVTYSYGGAIYSDFGLRMTAPTEAFELWSQRATYDDPIVTEWRSTAGTVALPPGTMKDFTGLPDFLHLEVRRVSDGMLMVQTDQSLCLNGMSERSRPDAPARSPYPRGCPYNPFTVGSVMGVQAGWSSSVFPDYGGGFGLKVGKYDLTASINPTYATAFGIDPADASAHSRVIVKLGQDCRGCRTAPTSPTARPADQRPAGTSGGRIAGPVPDIRSLPAFGVSMNNKGTAVRFAATVWNAGNSPLVVDGFRVAGTDEMDAYQYFFDADGNQTGYQAVGQMHWHAENHNHWHFEDFARYRLLNADLTQAVKSRKQSFCLANTDAVDYTVPDADWQPENTDLSTACGGIEARSIREVLSAGSGDTYFQYRYGQSFKLDGLENGIYYISVEGNPLGNLVESDTTNNDSLRKIRIGGVGEKRWVKMFPVGIIEEGPLFRMHRGQIS
jgi:hypothetical protein